MNSRASGSKCRDRQWWGKLTDDDLEKVGGQKDKLLGLIQEKYGYTREKAELEFNQHMAECHASQRKTAVPAK